MFWKIVRMSFANDHFWRNECQRYRVCKSKSGHFAWEVLWKSLTFILTQKNKNLDLDDPCHEKTTSKGCQNPTLMESGPSKGPLKRYQKAIKNQSQKRSRSRSDSGSEVVVLQETSFKPHNPPTLGPEKIKNPPLLPQTPSSPFNATATRWNVQRSPQSFDSASRHPPKPWSLSHT